MSSGAISGPERAPVSSSDPRHRFQIETIDDFDSFARLQPVWNELVETAGVPHPFLEHDWLCSWWEAFHARARLRVLIVREAGQPVAAVPLMLARSRTYGFPLPELSFIHNDHTPRFDFVVARPDRALNQAVWSHLYRAMPEWRILRLPQLTDGSPTLGDLPSMARESGCSVGAWSSIESPYLVLPDTWEVCFDSLSSRRRTELRRRLRRLEELGPVEYEAVTTGEGLEEALEDGFRMEAAGWKAHKGTAITSAPEIRNFYTLLARRAACRGWLYLSFLKCNGRRIAFHYCLAYKDRLFTLKPGFDPSFYTYSPGNILIMKLIEDAISRGFSEVDFLGACDSWKLDWTRLTRQHQWLYIFRPGMANRLLYRTKFHLVPGLRRGLRRMSSHSLQASAAKSKAVAGAVKKSPADEDVCSIAARKLLKPGRSPQLQTTPPRQENA